MDSRYAGAPFDTLQHNTLFEELGWSFINLISDKFYAIKTCKTVK